MSEKLKLLPCPFCGGKARAWCSNVIKEGHVECDDCHSATDYCDGKTERAVVRRAAKLWNRRTP